MLNVGSGQTYAVPSAAAAVAKSGDVIKIAAGDYTGDVAAWNADNLTICGAGGRARIHSGGNSIQGKGIWVISGANATVDNIEFHDAIIPYTAGNGSNNGAGIRVQNTTGSFTVINCGFYDGENGILGGQPGTTITIARSEFARNGYGDGYTHNLYIGQVDSLTVTASFFHEAKVGHNLKSRAKFTSIEDSYFMDGSSGTASYTLDFPNGGEVHLRGNLLQKGPLASNGTLVSYGEEGLPWTVNTLQLVYNTLVDARTSGTFVKAAGGTQSMTLTANVFAQTGGTSRLMGGPSAPSDVLQQFNVDGQASDIPGAGSISTPNFWPDATLLAFMTLTSPQDPAYTQDAPHPTVLRPLAASPLIAGALQSAP